MSVAVVSAQMDLDYPWCIYKYELWKLRQFRCGQWLSVSATMNKGLDWRSRTINTIDVHELDMVERQTGTFGSTVRFIGR